MTRRYTVTAHQKPPVHDPSGRVILVEAGVAVQGSAGESPQQVS